MTAVRNQKPAATSAPTDWHILPLAEIERSFGTGYQGLTEELVAERLRLHGPNELPTGHVVTVWEVLVHQFKNPLIYILAAAAALSASLDEWADAAFIGAVLAINAIIGGAQEWKAEQSSRALQKLIRGSVVVIRGGVVRTVESTALVPGDRIRVESGLRVPADIRLASAHGLEVDESLLTGESLAVHKDAHWHGEQGCPLGDRLNMLYAGSVVARGRGEGVVVATGGHTEVGRLAAQVTAADSAKPPLIVRMERFTRAVGVAVVLAAIIVAAIGVLKQGQSLQDMFLVAVALAVSAIPEGLPVSITVALSIASARMAKRGVLVRRLAAVEGLGSCTFVASDKTGTLTANELTVRRVWVPVHLPTGEWGQCVGVSGEGYNNEGEVHLLGDAPSPPPESAALSPTTAQALHEMAAAGALCNEAALERTAQGTWNQSGDPTDVALLALALKLGITREALLEAEPQVGAIPFEPERRFAASFHAANPGIQGKAYVKGAIERLLPHCAHLSQSERAIATAEATTLSAAGYRVLALARAPMPADALDASLAKHHDINASPPAHLELLGLVGMIDPIRSGVKEAISRCHMAGVQVAMVTGDHPVTALAISRELGLAASEDEVVTGQTIETDNITSPARIAKTHVFARVSPAQKLQIVESLQAAGHFVAVTGDGVNDAPALRAAHIGVAMGKGGTDVAREASELVITDDNFASIVAGIEEGRVAYDNIRKVVYLLVSTGFAEVVLLIASVATGLPVPLTAVQLLWLNLVTNGIQHIALTMEPAEGDVLTRPPRPPAEPMFNRIMVERTLVGGGYMGIIAFLVFQQMISNGWATEDARNALLLLMVLFENVHLGNSRSETRSAFSLSPLRSPLLLASALTALSLHTITMFVPGLSGLLGTSPLSFGVWATMGAVAASLVAAMELHTWWWKYRHPRTPAPSTA